VVFVKSFFKNPMINFLSSVKLGAILMAIIGIASIFGTFIESFYGGREAAYGLVYAAPWFEFTLGLFVLSLLLSFFKRMPYKPKQTGFAIIHLSMIVILISAGITRYFGYEGIMPIREGATVDYIFSDKVHARVTLGTQEASYPVRLFKPGKVDHWQKVILEGQEYELGITEFWPHFSEAYQEGPGGPAGFQFGVSQDGEVKDQLLSEGDRSEIGPVPVQFLTGDFSGEMSVSPYGDLRVRSDGEVCTIPVTLPDGVVHECGSLKLEITEFQASYAVGGESSSTGPMNNPMIRVAIIDGNGLAGDRVFFALHPEFQMGHSGAEDQFADLEMAYTVSSGVEFTHNSSDGLRARASFLISAMDLNTEERTEIAPGEIFSVKEQVLYLNETQGFSFVPVSIMNSVVLMPQNSDNPNAPAAARLTMRDKQGNEASAICVKHDRAQRVDLGGQKITLALGPIKMKLDYSLTLEDFVLNTYPGSDNPATYESYVLLNDAGQGIVNERVHIYMNNPLTHRGSKHFQSSYDPDRKGTVLSVNHDPGKTPTYIGYAMISIGFFLVVLQNLLFPTRKKKQVAAVVLAGLLGFGAAGSALAQEEDEHAGHNHGPAGGNSFTVLSDPARELASRLVIQDYQGRMKPLDTLAREMTMKVAKSTNFQKRHPVDMFLNWTANPQYWAQEDVIGVRHGGLKNMLGVDPETKRLSMVSLFENGKYRLIDMVREAHRTPDRERSKSQRKLLTFDERFNLLYMTFQGTTLRMFPVPGDENNTWLDINDVTTRLNAEQADQYSAAYTSLFNGLKTGDNSSIMKGLQGIDAIQHQYGAAVIPSDAALNAELSYNRNHIFSYMMIPLLGAFVLLMGVFFWNLFRNRMAKISFRNIFYSVGMLLYTVGAAGMIYAYVLRWIASGRAPISNGHESLLFISLAAVATGLISELIFRISLPASLSALLTVIIVGVSMLSVFDPAIGPLVPVLVSYWLNIHVTIITASYALFGLGFLLGTMILFLILQRGFQKDEAKQENLTFCLKILDKINFWILVVGIGMLTIGTLLGGVWANESWGRYWGWDPKETWSLITILVASVGLHFRYLKKMRSIWIHAWWNWVILDSVLMTYFGVNYFLVGLHSYGAGSAASVPVWVHVFNALMIVLIVASGIVFRNYNKQERVTG
jgi:cytochrome c-type biogenesis protein CcsB